MFLLWLVTLISEIISEIFFSLIIWSIVILLQISQTLKIFVCLKLLIKFLLDMQIIQMSWIQSLTLYFSNQIWNNSTIILFILNGECFFFFFNQQFIMRGVMADCGNYLVATIHWWAYNIKREKEKEGKKKERKKEKRKQT